MTSGVSEDGRGFVTISATSDSGILMVGQLPPNLVRDIGKHAFEAAEAAEVDAIIYNLLRTKFQLPDEVIAGFITSLREARED